MQIKINEDILKVVDTFSSAGYSGISAAYALDIINKLLAYRPITPIEDIEDQWGENQNLRCSALFRDEKGAYYLYAIVFRDTDNGSTFTSTQVLFGISSRQYVTFPFIPKTFYVDVTEDKNGTYSPAADTFKQIHEVFQYYKYNNFNEEEK